MDLKLGGARALVTGSSRGVGWAIARELAAEGASVVINGRDALRLGAAVDRIHQAVPGAEVDAVQADLSGAAGCQALQESVEDVDVLVCNLGVCEPRPFEVVSDVDWQHLFEVNVMSGVRLVRHHLPRMKSRGWGRIVFVSNEFADSAADGAGPGHMTTLAPSSILRGLTESCEGTGVTVNTVVPGPIRSEGTKRMLETFAREAGKSVQEVEQDYLARAHPTWARKRFLEPAELAPIVAYVCSSPAAGLTGSTLRLA